MTTDYKTVGIDYCLTHSGTRLEDDPPGKCGWWKGSGDDLPCRLVPLVYEPPPVPPGPSLAQRMDALVYALSHTPSSDDIAAMKAALKKYDDYVAMGAVPSGFHHDAARNLIAYALGMLGEHCGQPLTPTSLSASRTEPTDG